MEQITTLIGQLGFPIFTAVYFMTSLETHIKKSNELLTILIERHGGEQKL
jgi:hypothetical protein